MRRFSNSISLISVLIAIFILPSGAATGAMVIGKTSKVVNKVYGATI